MASRTSIAGSTAVTVALALSSLAQLACGGSTSSSGKVLGQDAGTDTSTGDAIGVDSTSLDTGLVGCGSSGDCDGGVCMSNGACCGSASDVCGSACCSAGSVCLFDACVVPGSVCTSSSDCAVGSYCEPALGAPSDAGVVDAGADAATCAQPLPTQGRCLPLPATCDSDGGVGDAAETSDGGCTAACEYHPPSVGSLDAIAKWTWGPTATQFPDRTDVWSTPTVGRVYDTNCDGKLDELDSPVIMFVSNNSKGTCCQCTGDTPTACHTGVLRMLDGQNGAEIWSLEKASATSAGFAGLSIAIGDIDGDGRADIVAVTGEGYVVLIDATGVVKATSDLPIPGNAGASFGWGGGLAIADMDGDGAPEIAYGATVFTTKGGVIKRLFVGTGGTGGGAGEEISTLVDLDGAPDNHLELLAGNTAYKVDGTVLWTRTDLPDGFPGVGDFNNDGSPEAVLVGNGMVWILNGATGVTVLGPFTLPGTGSGGPPTIADFDGDKSPDIGVAMATFYSVVKPNYVTNTIDLLWKTPNHDLSSSVTGSTVFDFEGDGVADVIYADECFLWVFNGQTGAVRFAAPHTSFTATEASLLADVDGDGHADMVMVSNGSDPSSTGWKCLDAAGNPAVVNGVTWTPGTTANKGYRGIAVYSDSADSWVGTRTLWSEHTYHVSNICDDLDSACVAPNVYGSIPKIEQKNWDVPWLNNFRQNVQDTGLFNAPDAVVSLTVSCSSPITAQVSVRNIGLAALPAGVNAGVFTTLGDGGTIQVGEVTTTSALFPGQTQTLPVTLTVAASGGSQFYAMILIDPTKPTFHECRTDNDTSAPASTSCIH